MHKFLADIRNTKWVDLSKFSDKEILDFYDNPDNFSFKNPKDLPYKEIIPYNFLLSLTHWTYLIPKQRLWNEENKIKNLRLLKNFSDFWTSYIVNSMWLDENKIVRTHYSRGIWDCNRDIKDRSSTWFVRDRDFSWNILFENNNFYKNIWIEHYKSYHQEISRKLEEIEYYNKKSILFDLHDTWVRLMWKEEKDDKLRKDLFPLICLSNSEWKSCDKELFDFFKSTLEFHLWIKAHINEPYKWWFVTNYHWSMFRQGVERYEIFKDKKENTNPQTNSIYWVINKEFNNKDLWNSKKRNVIQVEFWRYLYVKESTQEVNLEKASIIWEWLKRAIYDTAIKFN